MRMLMVSAFICATAAPALAAPPEPADEARLRALPVAVDEAWNAGDANRMAELYAAEGDLWTSGTQAPVVGREAIRQHFTRSFAARGDGWRHVSEVRRLEMIGRDTVFADTAVRLEQRQPDGGWKVTRRFSNVSIAVREGGAWKLRNVRAYVTGS